MSSEEAKEILLRCRPGTADADDPEMTRALALCERDPALRAWYDEHVRTQASVRHAFRQIVPPAGLQARILATQRAREVAWWRQPSMLAAAAALLLLATVAVVWTQLAPAGPGEYSLAAYHTRIVKEALRLYRMEVETSDLAQVRAHLTLLKSPADFSLPTPLTQAHLTGCATTRWQNSPVSMICFLKDKASTAPGVKSDLWLFVMDKPAVSDAPPAGQVKIAKVNRLTTATWIAGGKMYVLGTEGDEQAVRKWL